MNDASAEDKHRSVGWRGLVAAVLLMAVAVAVAVSWSGSRDDTIPDADLRNGQVFIQDNLWTSGDQQYAVWVGPAGSPYVGKRPAGGGAWDVANLATIPGNPLGAPTADDTHNVFAIAVDPLGYVHVAGNSHSSPLLSIRSSAPGDIHHWAQSPIASASRQVTYPRFVALADGTIQLWRREGVAGRGAIVVDEFHPEEETWHSLGAVLDGAPSHESPYPHRIAVDPRTGAIHLLFEWRSDPDPDATNDLGYVRSRDRGRTWERSDSTPVAVPVTHDSAETVIDTAPRGSGLRNDGGLTIDRNGDPHAVVLFEPAGGPRRIEHVWFDGRAWRRESLGSIVSGRPAIAATADGRVWLLGTDSTQHLVAVELRPGAGARHKVTRVPKGWEVTFDSAGLAQDGHVDILVPDGAAPHVVTAV